MHIEIHSPLRMLREDIPAILYIFRRDLHQLIRRPVALIICLGIAFIPSLYAWVNIYANWDPYGNTGHLKVAVASNDAGYIMEGVAINMGDNIIENLHANDAIGWQFVDADRAREGVQSGEYYAAVIIPEKFSEQVVTFIAGEAKRPAIEYYSNEKSNAIATKITNTGISTLRNTINEQFVNTVSSTIITMMNVTDSLLSEKSDALVDRLTETLTQMDKDLSNFSTSIDLLIETVRAVQEVTAAAQDLLPDMEGLVDQNILALQTIRRLTDSTGNTVSAMTDVLDANVNTLLNTGASIYDDLESAASDIGTVSSDGAAALERAADAAAQGQESALRLRRFFNDHGTRLVTMARNLDSAYSTLQKIGITLPGTHNGNMAADLQQSVSSMTSALDTLSDDLGAISRDAGNAAKILRTDGALPSSALQTLRSDLSSLRKSLDSMKHQYQDNVSPLLDESIGQLNAAIDSLSELLLTSNQNIPKIDTVLVRTDASLEHTAAALESTKTLLSDAQEQLKDLLHKLNSVEKDERLAKLMDIIRNDPGTVADFLSSPVELNNVHIYPVENYGSAMTPFYSILAIWVGGLLMSSILKTNVKTDDRYPYFPPTVAYLGRYCLFCLIAMLQALIICLGDLFLLQIQCLHPVRFVLVGIAAAVVYSLMIYTLAVSFKDVGKAIAVIIMVVQIAGSGGTFPVELLPPFFQAVNPYLPFTFGINAMRECIGGLYGNVYTNDLVSLCVIYIPISLLVGVVLRRPVIWLMNFFEHQVEKSGLM